MDNKITLLNIDCMEYMKGLQDKKFDLAIVDPPYLEGPNKPGFYRKGEYRTKLAPGGKYGELKPKHWKIPSYEYFVELQRVSKNQIVWGANHLARLFDASGPGWIVWDKENGSSSFADAELASSSFNKAVRIFRYRWNGMLQASHGKKRLKEKRIHPTQKPVKLYEWLLRNYAKEGDRILDTHAGSMSSVIACHYFGCDIVACEIDKDYFEAGKKRVEEETKQKALL